MDGSKASSSKKPFRWISEWNFLASGTCFVLCLSEGFINDDAPCRDTVCSVGFIPRQLPFTASNTTVRFFRHALALDERRATFLVNPWHRRRKDRDTTTTDERPKTDVREVWFAGCHAGFAFPLFFYGRITLTLCVCTTQTSVEGQSQIVRRTASRISLRWMILECFRTGSGIRFRKEALIRIGMDQNTLGVTL
jgi:hypothetical protein